MFFNTPKINILFLYLIMAEKSEKIFLKCSNSSLIEDSLSESQDLDYRKVLSSNVSASEKSISINEDIDSFDKSDENDLSSEISYQVEKDENNEKVLKLKIDLIIEDDNNRLFTLNLNINKKTYREMGKDLLED